MSARPSDIPESVWEEAEAAKDNAGPSDGWTVIIARAILAAEKRGEERERERCAQVAELYWDNRILLRLPSPSIQQGIAAAIRNPSHTNEGV